MIKWFRWCFVNSLVCLSSLYYRWTSCDVTISTQLDLRDREYSPRVRWSHGQGCIFLLVVIIVYYIITVINIFVTFSECVHVFVSFVLFNTSDICLFFFFSLTSRIYYKKYISILFSFCFIALSQLVPYAFKKLCGCNHY